MSLRTMFITLSTALLLAGAAQAQELTRLLPQDAILALGIEGLAEHEDKLQAFVDEFRRLEVGEALSTLLDSADEEMTDQEFEEDIDAIAAPFEGLTVYDLLGQEAWLALSASPFSPIPSLVVLSDLSPEAATRFDAVLAEAVANAGPELQTLEESGVSFYVLPIDEPDSPVQAVAFAKSGDLLALSTNPETLRGVLRLQAGSSEPSLAAGDAFRQAFDRLEGGNLSFYLDYAQIAETAEPFAQGMGFDPLIERLGAALRTAGAVASVVRLTDAGIETETFQAVNRSGGDEALYALLTSGEAADRTTVDFAPPESLSYGSSVVDLDGWWAYLNELARSVPELGGDLNTLILSFVGVDLQTTFFDWAGPHVSSVTTGLAETVDPGMPVQNMLGEFVYLIEARDEEAARTGLQTLFQNASQTVAAFSDPSGEAGGATLDVDEVAGVPVSSYDFAPGLSLGYAVTDGYALIGTSRESLRAVLEARQASANRELLDRIAELPEGASSLGYSDTQATLEGTARQLSTQFQLMAGLSGAANLDFEAVSRATSAVEQFLLYVAERFDSSLSYGERSAEGRYSRSEMGVDW